MRTEHAVSCVFRATWVSVGLLVTVVSAGCWQPPPLPEEPDAGPPTEADLLLRRPYQVSVPVAYDPQRKWPLLLSLHGYGRTGKETATWLGLPALVDTKNVFLVAPNGAVDSQGYRAWHPTIQPPHFDSLYLSAIVHDLKAKYSIDPGQVFVIGHSQGAHMAHKFACDDSAEVAGVIALAGQLIACAATEPVSALQIHGTEDDVIGYFGDVQNDPPQPTIPSAHQSIAVWAKADACRGAIQATDGGLDLTTDVAGDETLVERYSGCAKNADVELWSMQGAGHRPNFSDQFLDLVWGFFTQHAR